MAWFKKGGEAISRLNVLFIVVGFIILLVKLLKMLVPLLIKILVPLLKMLVLLFLKLEVVLKRIEAPEEA